MQPNGASGPDASKVWNKNRRTLNGQFEIANATLIRTAIPPPPPRQFTDEELQKQYGIHLATRLQSDEAGKDPKWADIDDDEDDWAPDQVEWMDGTKSSVPVIEAQPSPAPEEKKDPVTNDAPGEASLKPVPTSIQRPEISGGAKTILKPGAAPPGSQQKTGGLVLKGAPEKPTLVAKTPTGPSKSPWAPLPPVDKMSPVVVNPPVQQQSSSRFQRDPHGFDALGATPSPAKEIAADDFNRSWRDDRGTKELFNSQSGRYEPVTEARRSSRQEHGYRQPAVLQRPSHHGGPAEPSPAFQTSRSGGGETGSWAARRRASSNLSGGSAGRRPSFGRLQDLSTRPELPEGVSPVNSSAVESPRLGFANIEQSPSNQSSWVQRPSNAGIVQQSAGPPSDAPTPVNGEVQPSILPEEDHVVRQERLMREKIERAKAQKQREKEAEDREAAARAERLKQKLAALAVSSPSPELKDRRPKESLVSTKSPKQQQRLTPAASPPKPPVPTSAGEVAQYGMMKVHQPQPVKRSNILETSLAERSSLEHYTDGTQPPRRAGSPVRPVGRATQPQQQSRNPTVRIPKRLPDAPAENPNPSWKSPSPSESYTWGNKTINTHTVPGGNVWGPPTREKALGNGTFDTHSLHTHSHPFSHSNFNSRSTPAIAHGSPGPIAPPSSLKNSSRSAFSSDSNNYSQPNSTFAQSQSSQHHSATQLPASSNQPLNSHPQYQHAANMQGPIVSPSPSAQGFPDDVQRLIEHVPADQSVPAQQGSAKELRPTQDGRPGQQGRSAPTLQQNRNTVPSQPARLASPGNYRNAHNTIPVRHPPNRPPPKVENADVVADGHKSSINDWVHSSNTQKDVEYIAATKAKLAYDAKKAVETEEPTLSQAEKVDTFVLTTVDANGRRRKITTTKMLRDTTGNIVDEKSFDGFLHNKHGQNSRFFEKGAPRTDVGQASLIDFNAPPPAETSDHPAHDGDFTHPIVNLPIPKPMVRLPPGAAKSAAAARAAEKAVFEVGLTLCYIFNHLSNVFDQVHPAAVQTAPVMVRPIVQQEGWQDRFRALFGNNAAPTTPAQSAVVNSASKTPLVEVRQQTAIRVSVPYEDNAARITGLATTLVFTTKGIDSKPQADEELFEQPAFASKPAVRLPSSSEVATWFPSNRGNLARPSVTASSSKSELEHGMADTVTVNLNKGADIKVIPMHVSPGSGYAKLAAAHKQGQPRTQGQRRNVSGNKPTNNGNSNGQKMPSSERFPKIPKRNTNAHNSNNKPNRA
jgi:hypothetical protein